jgi:hypothetical protein
MSLQRCSHGALLGALCLVLGSHFALAQAPDTATQLSVCRALQNAAERLVCYDRLADGFTTLAVGARSAPSPAPAAPTLPPSPNAVPGREATNERFAQDRLPAEKREVAPEPEAIEANITALRLIPGGFVEVTLDTGQVWRQTEGEPMRLALGAKVRVRKGLVGGFLLNEIGRNKSHRVRRME